MGDNFSKAEIRLLIDLKTFTSLQIISQLKIKKHVINTKIILVSEN